MFPVCVLDYKTEFAIFCFFDVGNTDKTTKTQFAFQNKNIYMDVEHQYKGFAPLNWNRTLVLNAKFK